MTVRLSEIALMREAAKLSPDDQSPRAQRLRVVASNIRAVWAERRTRGSFSA